MRSQHHVLPAPRQLSEPSRIYGFQPGEKDRQDAAGPQGTKGLGQAKKQLSASCWSFANPAQILQDCSRPAAGSLLFICQGSHVPGYIKRRELWMVAFFSTIDDSDWLERPRLAPFLPVTQPHQVAQKRSQANRNLAIGTRGGKQINQHDPMAVMACERDRFDTLLAGTHGMRPPERLHMRWTNTWFRQGVELSRGAMQQFNLQQMATGQGQINPVARLVVARTNQLQAMAGPQLLPHKLYSLDLMEQQRRSP
ncbi:hypothetical protein WJX84_007865 [Apatococcus fuscideae]|uniref:Uncharacterized protein n=1 Tax=Apatococcus fuscideae TaxID=2026836 RepID=A0AAW1THG5_9CHLO